MRAGLGAFADGLFQDNAYEESPLFRGLYLTGQDRPADLGAQEPRQAFSREFFTEILPGDRRLRSTLNSAERAQALVRRLALSGWGIAMIVAFGLLGWAYVSDKAFSRTPPSNTPASSSRRAASSKTWTPCTSSGA